MPGRRSRSMSALNISCRFPGGWRVAGCATVCVSGRRFGAAGRGHTCFRQLRRTNGTCGSHDRGSLSTKIGPGGSQRVLQEVSDPASNLWFSAGGRRLALRRWAIRRITHLVPYHQLQFLRNVMLGQPPGQRLQDWLAAIERSPTRRFAPERPLVGPDRVRRLDHRAVQSVFTRLERLVPVPAGTALAQNALAKALTFGEPAKTHFRCGWLLRADGYHSTPRRTAS